MSSLPRGSKLGILDDLPIHQHANVISQPASDQWNWTERWYFNLQRRSGELVGIIGGGVFRNTAITESYFCFQNGDYQFNTRTTRAVAANPLSDGLVNFAIIDPMNVWQIDASHKESEIDVNLKFVASNSPFLFKPFWVGPDRDSGEFDQYEHFVQPGIFTGTVSAHGINFHEGEALTFRDRTWGVRSRRPRLHNWIVLHFDDGSFMSLVHQETEHGRYHFSHAGIVQKDGSEEILEIESHDITFDPISRIPQHGAFVLRGPKGRLVTLEMSAVGESIRGLGAGYDPMQGKQRSNSEDIMQSKWDIKNPEEIERIGRGTIDTGVKCAISSSSSPIEGVGVWETALGVSHYRYGKQIAEIKKSP